MSTGMGHRVPPCRGARAPRQPVTGLRGAEFPGSFRATDRADVHDVDDVENLRPYPEPSVGRSEEGSRAPLRIR